MKYRPVMNDERAGPWGRPDKLPLFGARTRRGVTVDDYRARDAAKVARLFLMTPFLPGKRS